MVLPPSGTFSVNGDTIGAQKRLEGFSFCFCVVIFYCFFYLCRRVCTFLFVFRLAGSCVTFILGANFNEQPGCRVEELEFNLLEIV